MIEEITTNQYNDSHELRAIIEQVRDLVISRSKEINNYPYGRCLDISSLIHAELNLSIVKGSFIGAIHTDYYQKIIRKQTTLTQADGLIITVKHWWNYNQKTGHYIDATIKQFNNDFPEIFVIKEEHELIPSLYQDIEFI